MGSMNRRRHCALSEVIGQTQNGRGVITEMMVGCITVNEKTNNRTQHRKHKQALGRGISGKGVDHCNHPCNGDREYAWEMTDMCIRNSVDAAQRIFIDTNIDSNSIKQRMSSKEKEHAK